MSLGSKHIVMQAVYSSLSQGSKTGGERTELATPVMAACVDLTMLPAVAQRLGVWLQITSRRACLSAQAGAHITINRSFGDVDAAASVNHTYNHWASADAADTCVWQGLVERVEIRRKVRHYRGPAFGQSTKFGGTKSVRGRAVG